MSRIILPGNAHRAAGKVNVKLTRASRNAAPVVAGEDGWLACARLASGQELVAANYDPLIAQTTIPLSNLSSIALLNLCMVYVPRSVVAARIGYGCDSLGLTVGVTYNGLCLYSYDAIDRSATLVDSSANTVNTWNGRSVFSSRPLLNGYTIGRGVWLIGGVAAGSAPSGNLYGRTVPDMDPNQVPSAAGLANGGIVAPRAFEIPISGFTSPPATIDLLGGRSGYTVAGAPALDWPWWGLYSA